MLVCSSASFCKTLKAGDAIGGSVATVNPNPAKAATIAGFNLEDIFYSRVIY
jgi:hypothetical protein